MESAKELITKNLKQVAEEISREKLEVKLEVPEDPTHGDYSSNIALALSSSNGSKKLGKNPKEIAEQIKLEASSKKLKAIEKIEVAGPGFLNFYLSKSYLESNLSSILQEKENFGHSNILKNVRMMVEFAHPNTHKEFHIGHVRNITTGETICRILSSQGANVSRVNYQGDVGMHVAKALCGIKKLESRIKEIEESSSAEKAKFLGEAYALGSKEYEERKEAKKEIGEINKKIYAKDPETMTLWEKTREWSLEYFESIYKRFDTKFDRLFFESEVFESGKEIVLSHVDDGTFVKDQGAVIFPGEKYGLHNRVFVTSEGNPTYEGKEMGLAPLQYEEFKFDKAIHVVGPEQAGYFTVVFKAIERVFPELEGKEKHLGYGFVQLKDGKMSSRLGNIIRGEWLLDEAKSRLLKNYPEMGEDVAEDLAVGAVKYSMLKVGREANIFFNFEESINLHGNSGPYIQYTYARTQSILEKGEGERVKGKVGTQEINLEKEETDLLRKIVHFPEVVSEAAEKFAPNHIALYLFELSQAFNMFYEKHRILNIDKEETRNFRLELTAGVGQVLKNGLELLGIKAPAKI